MTKSLVTALIIIVVALGIAMLVSYGAGDKGKYSAEALDNFARCLAAKNVTMYGAYSCPHCQNQKAMFGSSFKFVPYVECSEEAEKCVVAKIEGVPTWTFSDGKKLVGEQPLEMLAAASGCPLPEPNVK